MNINISHIANDYDQYGLFDDDVDTGKSIGTITGKNYAKLFESAPQLFDIVKNLVGCIAYDGTTCKPNKSTFQKAKQIIYDLKNE